MNPHRLGLSSDDYYHFVAKLCIAIFSRDNFMEERHLGGLSKLWWTKEIDMLIYNFYSNVKAIDMEMQCYSKWDFTAFQPEILYFTPHSVNQPQLGDISLRDKGASKVMNNLNNGVSLYLIADGLQNPYP